jgi:chaperonin GroES
MKIKPLGDHVLIEPISAEEVKKFGKISIIMPETAGKERPEQGKVVAAGPGKFDEDGQRRVPMSVKKGDTVLFTKYGPNEIKIDGKEYLIAEEKDILAILE